MASECLAPTQKKTRQCLAHKKLSLRQIAWRRRIASLFSELGSVKVLDIASLKGGFRKSPPPPHPEWTPLGDAMYLGNLAYVKLLVEAGADLDALQRSNRQGCGSGSALIWVAGSGSAFKLRIWIRIQEGKNPQKKVQNFHVLKCWMFSFEGWRLLL